MGVVTGQFEQSPYFVYFVFFVVNSCCRRARLNHSCPPKYE